MSKYLLEIGTEELPYSFIASAIEQLKNNIETALNSKKVTFDKITTNATPRRLVAIIEGISEHQPDSVTEIKGPPAKIAFDANGGFTNAALGFAKKLGIEASSLYKSTQDGVEYAFAKVEEKGKDVKELLGEILPECVLKMQGSHFMRWAGLDVKFQRPIRWIVSIMDNIHVPVEIAEIKSSKMSRAHRFNEQLEVEISDIDSYYDILRQAHVIVDIEERKAKVVKEAEALAAKIGANVKIEPELLEEVTNITEWPIAVLGEFAKEYLDIPAPVTVTVMATHQRYFPIYDNNGKLKNGFITMSNFIGDNFDNIKQGNERVIKARLDDAIFFYKEDLKKTLESRVENLKGTTFQKGLGTLFDKVQRIREISAKIADNLGVSAENKVLVDRTALLCKSDLQTNLVFEFTELQGVIGGYYAVNDNEKELVVKGIEEHYYPIVADGELSDTITGQIVGIADKIDTIAGVFSIGKIPTGSVDPLGLRRASVGVIQTIFNKKLNIDLHEIIEFSVSKFDVENRPVLVSKIEEFIIQRLKGILEEYRYDVIDAALSSSNPLKDLNDFKSRLVVTSELVKNADYNKFHESANRIIRLIKDNNGTEVSVNLFIHKTENELYEKVSALKNVSEYSELVQELIEITPFIEAFFDNVLVMDKDEAVKRNRLNLLTQLKEAFFKIADFSKIVA